MECELERARDGEVLCMCCFSSTCQCERIPCVKAIARLSVFGHAKDFANYSDRCQRRNQDSVVAGLRFIIKEYYSGTPPFPFFFYLFSTPVLFSAGRSFDIFSRAYNCSVCSCSLFSSLSLPCSLFPDKAVNCKTTEKQHISLCSYHSLYVCVATLLVLHFVFAFCIFLVQCPHRDGRSPLCGSHQPPVLRQE